MIALVLLAVLRAETVTFSAPTTRAELLLLEIAKAAGEQWRWAKEFDDAPLYVRATGQPAEELKQAIAAAVQGKWIPDGEAWRLVPDTDARKAAREEWRKRAAKAWVDHKGRLGGNTGLGQPEGAPSPYESLLNDAWKSVPPEAVDDLNDMEAAVFSNKPKAGQKRLDGDWAPRLKGLADLHNEFFARIGNYGRNMEQIAPTGTRLVLTVVRDGQSFTTRAWVLHSNGASIAEMTGRALVANVNEVAPRFAANPDRFGPNWGRLTRQNSEEEQALLRPFITDPEKNEPLGLVADDWAAALPGNVVACWPANLDLLWRPIRQPEEVIRQINLAGGEFVEQGSVAVIRPRQYETDISRRTPRASLQKFFRETKSGASQDLSTYVSLGRVLPLAGREMVFFVLDLYNRNFVQSPNDWMWETISLLGAASLPSLEGDISGELPLAQLKPMLRERIILGLRTGRWVDMGIVTRDGNATESYTCPEPTEWMDGSGGVSLMLRQSEFPLFEMKNRAFLYRTRNPGMPIGDEPWESGRIAVAQSYYWELGGVKLGTQPLMLFSYPDDMPWLSMSEIYKQYPQFDPARFNSTRPRP